MHKRITNNVTEVLKYNKSIDEMIEIYRFFKMIDMII